MLIKLTEKMKYIKGPNLKVEKIVGGLDWPTSIAFLGQDDILVLEKNTGKVCRIVNGVMLVESLLGVNVATDRGSGVLGIAIAKHQEKNNQ